MNALMLTTGGVVDEQPCVDSNMAFSSYKWVAFMLYLIILRIGQMWTRALHLF